MRLFRTRTITRVGICGAVVLYATVGAAQQGGRGGAMQPQAPQVVDVQQMLAALPDSAPAKACHQLPVNDPARAQLANCAPDRRTPRRVLVLARAAGFVHSSIPLAARTIEALGMKTGAWQTTITFNAADINAANLSNYDAIYLDSTTGAFLDEAGNDPAAQAVSDARRKALMDFVRSGKGIAGIHAATDSYHARANGGEAGTWPDFNVMIGGFFKFHWSYPTQIRVKIDDPSNPINAAFTQTNQQGQRTAPGFSITDEVYTFAQDSWSRKRVHVLTSIDYARMPQEVKDQEPANGRRTDGDYGLSYLRREGNGRVFVNVLGHDESIYKLQPMLAHTLAGMLYVLGDLTGVDDSPSVK